MVMATRGNKWLLRLPKYPPRYCTTRVIGAPARTAGNTDEERNRNRTSDGDRDQPTKYATVCWHISLVILISTMILALVWTIYLSVEYYACSSEERFEKLRQDFVVRERRRRVGGKLKLNDFEEMANARLLAIKQVDEELHHIWSDYQPRPHFLSKYKMNETDLYSVLRAMPKGGLLHVHDAGMFRADRLIELTQYSNLWACVGSDGSFEDFRFSQNYPLIEPQGDYKCNWMLMSNFRQQDGNITSNKLRECLTINSNSFMSATHLANHMRRAHRLIHGLITYRPIWPTYLISMLEDFYADGVSYVELRSSLPIVSTNSLRQLISTNANCPPQMYDLVGTNYTIADTANSIVSTTNIFRSIHDDFIGIKLIYAPLRDYNDSKMDTYISNARFLKVESCGF